MNAEGNLDRLVAAGVIEADEEAVRLADGFRAAVGDRRDELATMAESERRERLADVFGEGVASALFEPEADHLDVMAAGLALGEAVEDADEELLTALPVVESLRHAPRAEGAPEAFLPVRGDQVAPFTQLFDRAIVYVWREDCDPCDIMREEFDELLDADEEEIALFAVFGPPYAQHLDETFDVGGGPTTLFFLEGEVDARLMGAHHQEMIVDQIEMLRELGPATQA